MLPFKPDAKSPANIPTATTRSRQTTKRSIKTGLPSIGLPSIASFRLSWKRPKRDPLRPDRTSHVARSHMDRALVDGERGFLDRLGQRRMRVAGARRDPRPSRRTPSARAASAIISPALAPMMWTPSTRSVVASARIFTKPSVVVVGLGAAVGGERELADLVGDAGGLQLLLGLADATRPPGRCRRRWG